MTRQPLKWGAPVRRAPVSGRPQGLRLGFALARGMKVGLLGGSFNPVHDGHTHVAKVAMERMGLDRLIWLVSPQNPLKSRRDTAPLAQRMAGVRAVAGPREIVSDLETRLGVAYTVDTIRLLQARYPGVHFVWIMGADNLATFHLWRGWSEILRRAPLAVVSRPYGLMKSRLGPAARRFPHARLPSRQARLLPFTAAPAWTFLRGPLKKTTSTAIRAGLKGG